MGEWKEMKGIAFEKRLHTIACYVIFLIDYTRTSVVDRFTILFCFIFVQYKRLVVYTVHFKKSRMNISFVLCYACCIHIYNFAILRTTSSTVKLSLLRDWVSEWMNEHHKPHHTTVKSIQVASYPMNSVQYMLLVSTTRVTFLILDA